MEVIDRHADVPLPLAGGAVAIGNFDGVHRGHQKVLETAIATARAHGIPAGVMAFEPHPRVYFQPQRPLFRLTPLETKLELFAALGLDFAAILPFDAALAVLDAGQFIERVLVAGFHVRHVVIGDNFFFGAGRSGNPQVMRERGEALGFSTSIVGLQGEAGDRFSSSRVRELLQEGDPRGAAEMLGYWWRIRGKVTGGAQIGTWLGFPTANITLEDTQEFHHGIYAVRVYVDGVRHHGAAYLGTRPTFDDGHPVLETFLFDFSENIYGKDIAVELIAFIREDQRFRDAEALKRKMQEDCDEARRLLAAIERDDPMQRFPLGRARAKLHAT